MNGTIGTSARAGWNPPRYSAAHDSDAWAEEVRPEAACAARRSQMQQADRRAHEQRRAQVNESGPRRIEDREDDQAQRIVGDRQQQQERDGRMAWPER